MTRFALSCSSGSVDKLLGYGRTIANAHIPGVRVSLDCPYGSDAPLIGMVWLWIDTLDALLAVKQLLDKELIISGNPSLAWGTIEIYDDWRE